MDKEIIIDKLKDFFWNCFYGLVLTPSGFPSLVLTLSKA